MKHWRIIFWIFIVIVLILGAISNLVARADDNPGTNISSLPEESAAWNDVTGWWNFHGSHTINVEPTKLTGYATSESIGDILLDCATSPGADCNVVNFGICNGFGPHEPDGSCPNGDSSGELTGYAWNDTIGWISFNCDQEDHGGPNVCVPTPYGVSIEGTTGDFSGNAWNDTVGWINFSGTIPPLPPETEPQPYVVNTGWRATSSVAYLNSSVFDTRVQGGATLNSIIWQGTSPAGTSVDFQIAASNDAKGPWIFKGPGGNEVSYFGSPCPNPGTQSSGAPENIPICVERNLYANQRYLRYRVRLRSDEARQNTPIIEDIILNWSR